MNAQGSSPPTAASPSKVDTRQPLAGVRVVEFGSLLAGPFCTRFLGDFGAEVIKVEQPDGGDPMREWGPVRHKDRSLVWPSYARNKKCITLDLRVPEGQELALRLISRADVVVENFRPQTMERWGLGYDDLRRANHKVIMVRVSGYGQTGPYRDRAGFGAAAGAMGGLRYLTGYPDRPPVRAGLSIEDSIAGLQAVIGTLLALYHRDAHSGSGQEVDVSLVEAVLSLTEGVITEYALTGHQREREGTTLPGVAPSNVYRAQDGKWLVIAANATGPFKRLCGVMGLPALGHEPRYQTNQGRWADREVLDEMISTWVGQRTAGDAQKLLDDAGVPAAPIYSAADVLSDPHFRARGSVIECEDGHLGRIAMAGVVPKLSATPGQVVWTGPALGEHNEDVYLGILGLSVAELNDYRGRRVI
jgi:succinyl-CoA---D-citramalate CoA-transferase